MDWLRIALILYGFLNLALGILGAAAGSMVSLAAAGGAGVLAIVGAILAKTRPAIGYGLGALVCVGLLGRFVPKLMKEFVLYPGGIVAAASALMLILLVVGHFSGKRPQ